MMKLWRVTPTDPSVKRQFGTTPTFLVRARDVDEVMHSLRPWMDFDVYAYQFTITPVDDVTAGVLAVEYACPV